tara:strand:- start:2517 stop:2738 length:222 start_codon:yes stop_codon:yes gene_type:complete
MGKTQTDIILEHLQKGQAITPIEAAAWPLCCMRLAARIKNLRDQGHNIVTDNKTTPQGKRYASYRLVPEGRLF